MASQFQPKTYSVVVTSGAGSVTISDSGVAIGIAIKPPDNAQGNPDPSAEYGFEFLDDESFGIIAQHGCIGPQTTPYRFQLHGPSNTFSIIGGTVDGTYKLRVWFDE